MENEEYYIEKYKNIKDKLDLYLNDIEEILMVDIVMNVLIMI